MKLTTFTTGTLGLAGLVTAGLLALPSAAPATAVGSEDRYAKRDDDTPEVVLVADDDDDDTNARDNTGTQTRTQGQTRTRSRGSNDNTGTGTRTGRDDSRERQVRDLTSDGPGRGNLDDSRNHTNDRSRHNTRG